MAYNGRKRKSWGSAGEKGQLTGYYMGRRTKGVRMAAYNARIRRELINILWDVDEPLTKQEITTHLMNRLNLLSTPSPISLGTILSRNPQVNSEKSVIITTGDGRRRRVPQYEVNFELIRDYNDILFTLPFNALSKEEAACAKQCTKCGRRRYFEEHLEYCLECTRFPK